MKLLDVKDPSRSADAIAAGAEILRRGGLVAFPTETVYGLGANALDPAAIARIYEAKGRPAWNPLIIHVADVASARRLVLEWTTLADTLAHAFWPGPLTLVLKRAPAVPSAVSAGLDSIAIRFPDAQVARQLIEAAGVPLAAPSANRSTAVSPTRAEHVARSLGERVDLILDGGPTRVGIESTVVDVTGDRAVILRPGSIGRAEIEALVPTSDADDHEPGLHRRSPGQMERHYAPRARVILFDGDRIMDAGAMSPRTAAVTHSLRDVAGASPTIHLGDDPHAYAAALYDTLHRLDDEGCEVILVERPPDGPDWEAVRDRLARASTRG